MNTLSLSLMVIGVTGFIGIAAIGVVLKFYLNPALIAIPLLMAVIAIAFGA
ncbi:hypothetical protein [Lysobacter changpingensis]|uniref:hypothetical protein n=1 Tax=Lysobacter changpingensis TaxID=2792784 RepID=UPI001A8F6D49|nr:hypothetical protein [Lysobacter changpingensis]